MSHIDACHHCGGKLEIREIVAEEYKVIHFWCPECRSMVYVGLAKKGDKKALERAAQSYNEYVSEKWRAKHGT